MVDRFSLISKVQKLLALSQSDSEGEAALAASRAQEIIDKYNIAQHELEVKSGEKVEEVGIEQWRWDDPDRVDRWMKDLLVVVTENFYCTALVSSVGPLVIGRKTDLELAHYIYDAIRNQLTLIAPRRVAELKQRYIVRNAKKFRRDWLIGAVQGIAKQLTERRLQAAQTSKALVVSRGREREDFIEANLKVTHKKARQITISDVAHSDGFQNGKDLSIPAGIATSPSPKQLS